MRFHVLKMQGRKTGKCSVCGKRATRSKTFWQTLNPCNKNTDGTVKTRNDVYSELWIEKCGWEDEPITHERCENIKGER